MYAPRPAKHMKQGFPDKKQIRSLLSDKNFVMINLSAFLNNYIFRKTSYAFLLLGTVLFMCGYITVATLTASNVNEVVDDICRGTANGIFNSFQYLGYFAGAAVTGALWGVSEPLTWLVTIAVGLAGFVMTIYGKNPQKTVLEEESRR